MAAPTVRTVDTVPPPATRADAPADYVPKQDKFMAALPPLAVQINGVAADMNALGGYLDQLKTDVNGYKNTASTAADSASGSASTAATSASQAQTYASAAQAAAGAPAIAGKADQVLSVNANATGVEYRLAPLRPTAARAGMAVAYNAAGNAFEARAFPLSPITQYFESSAMAITGGSVLTVNHGFGSRPKIVMVHLVCIQAVNGYSVGDIIELSGHTIAAISTVQPLIEVFHDTTKISVVINSNASVSLLPKAGNGGGTAFGMGAYFNMVIRGAA